MAHTQLRRVRQPVRPGRDPPLALGTVELDVRRLELLPVVHEATHLDRRRRQEAMPEVTAPAVTGPNVDRHDLAIEQADDAVQRPHPAHR